MTPQAPGPPTGPNQQGPVLEPGPAGPIAITRGDGGGGGGGPGTEIRGFAAARLPQNRRDARGSGDSAGPLAQPPVPTGLVPLRKLRAQEEQSAHLGPIPLFPR